MSDLPTSPESEAEKFGFRLWQERAPHGEWFIATPHDDHLCFGSDVVGARQCLSAISRLCGELNAARSQLVIARQHVGWLKQYVQGMSDANWRDMRDRADRQLETFSSDLSDEGAQRAKIENHFAGRTCGRSIDDHTFTETDDYGASK